MLLELGFEIRVCIVMMFKVNVSDADGVVLNMLVIEFPDIEDFGEIVLVQVASADSIEERAGCAVVTGAVGVPDEYPKVVVVLLLPESSKVEVCITTMFVER